MIVGLAGLLMLSDSSYLYLKAEIAQQLLQKAWDQSLVTLKPQKPWPWADTESIAKLSFDRLKETYIVLSGSSGRSLAFAPGHLSGSNLPGKGGHIIISAHRDTHFNVLEKVKVTDKIQIQTIRNEQLIYEVTDINIVDTREEGLLVETDKNMLTLITCYPFNSVSADTPYRLRVDSLLINMPE